MDSYKESEGDEEILKHLYRDPSWNSTGFYEDFYKDFEGISKGILWRFNGILKDL